LKPKGDEQNQGLLEYLEEIIGTNVYVPRIQQAELKLDEIAERVAEKQHRANESEKQMKELEAPKDEAVGYIKLEQESFSYRNLTLSIQRHEFDKKRVELEQETAVLEEQKKVVEEEAEEKKRENKESIDEFNEARNAAKAAKKRMD
jgi:structural maintenance of chromosome 4